MELEGEEQQQKKPQDIKKESQSWVGRNDRKKKKRGEVDCEYVQNT